MPERQSITVHADRNTDPDLVIRKAERLVWESGDQEAFDFRVDTILAGEFKVSYLGKQSA